MNKQVYKLFDTVLSPDKVHGMKPCDLASRLIQLNLVKTEDDFNQIIIESLQRFAIEDDEFPVHYYAPDEPLPEEAKIIEDQGEMLTDDLVNSMKS